MRDPLRTHLLHALAEVASDHSIASTQALVGALRRHLAGERDPELDVELIRVQFMIASRRYLRAAPALLRAHESRGAAHAPRASAAGMRAADVPPRGSAA